MKAVLDGWQPPAVVVFGAESSGKSTLLERVSLTPLFPIGKRTCTRLPVVISLRYGNRQRDPAITLMTGPFRVQDGEAAVNWLECFQNFYRKHDAGKVGTVPALLAKPEFVGKEEKLFKALCAKYKVDVEAPLSPGETRVVKPTAAPQVIADANRSVKGES